MARDVLQPLCGRLPGYSVRESARARRVRLVMSAEGGLEVVVPRRFDQRKIPGLLESKRDWIERAGTRIKDRTEAPAAPAGGRSAAVAGADRAAGRG